MKGSVNPFTQILSILIQPRIGAPLFRRLIWKWNENAIFPWPFSNRIISSSHFDKILFQFWMNHDRFETKLNERYHIQKFDSKFPLNFQYLFLKSMHNILDDWYWKSTTSIRIALSFKKLTCRISSPCKFLQTVPNHSRWWNEKDQNVIKCVTASFSYGLWEGCWTLSCHSEIW
jgi:hypothetical protein